MRLSKHYLKFTRNILLSKNNYKFPHIIPMLSKLQLTITMDAAITNYLFAAVTLLLLVGAVPRFNRRTLYNNTNAIFTCEKVLQKKSLTIFIDRLLNFIIPQSFLLPNTLLIRVYKNTVIFRLSNFLVVPEIYILLPSSMLNKIVEIFILYFTFWFSNTRIKIFEWKLLLHTVLPYKLLYLSK